MTDSLPVLVVDTNILIDFNVGGLLGEFFRLSWKLIAPDVILAEAENPDRETLENLGLESRELSGDQVADVFRLRTIYPQPSANDLFALVLARDFEIPLLTGDRHLRTVAEQERVLVHGTLWCLDEMVKLKLIAPTQAYQALQDMLKGGSRLPKAECQKRLKRWARSK
jgi:hypothetical protein